MPVLECVSGWRERLRQKCNTDNELWKKIERKRLRPVAPARGDCLSAVQGVLHGWAEAAGWAQGVPRRSFQPETSSTRSIMRSSHSRSVMASSRAVMDGLAGPNRCGSLEVDPGTPVVGLGMWTEVHYAVQTRH